MFGFECSQYSVFLVCAQQIFTNYYFGDPLAFNLLHEFLTKARRIQNSMWLDPINQERRKVIERDEDREEMGHE